MKNWIQHPILPAGLVLTTTALTACEGRSQSSVPLFGKVGQRAKAVPSIAAADATTVRSRHGPHLLPQTHAILFGIRGGAVDRKLVAATAGASILTLYGTACALSPDEVLKGYGVASTPVTTFMTRNASVLTITATFVIWCLTYTETSVNRAVGIAAVPYVLRSLQNIFNQTPSKFGYSAIIEYISLALVPRTYQPIYPRQSGQPLPGLLSATPLPA